MYPNILDGAIAAEDMIAIEAALTTLETKLSILVALSPQDRQKLPALGPQSVSFADQALLAGQQNSGLIPTNLNLTSIQRDKDLRQQLLPLNERIQKLATKMDCTIMLAGSEYYRGALAIYKVLQAFGKAAGLEVLLADLKRRFVKPKAKQDGTPTTPNNPTDPSI